MIQHCLASPPTRRGDGPAALVLAPTRELAQQVLRCGTILVSVSHTVPVTVIRGSARVVDRQGGGQEETPIPTSPAMLGRARQRWNPSVLTIFHLCNCAAAWQLVGDMGNGSPWIGK